MRVYKASDVSVIDSGIGIYEICGQRYRVSNDEVYMWSDVELGWVFAGNLRGRAARSAIAAIHDAASAEGW